MITPRLIRALILSVVMVLLAVSALAQGGNLASYPSVQSFTTLYDFQPVDPFSGANDDGANPDGNLAWAGNILYGNTGLGGTNDEGTVFAFDISANRFTSLYTFTATDPDTGTNTDGAIPKGMMLSGGTLYGVTLRGGNSGSGALFAIRADGTGFTNFYNFTATDPDTDTNSDGSNPNEGLILLGDTLYGTCLVGGTNGNGTVFAVKTNGTGFRTLYCFTAMDPVSGTNTDGAQPGVGLALSGNTLYGTAWYGGAFADGTIFAINVDGTGFTNLASFDYDDGGFPQAPPGPLVLSGNTLFGTTQVGGTNGNGSVFVIHTNGTGFADVYDFSPNNFDDAGDSTNADGIGPGALALSGNILFGSAVNGGSAGNGTLFALRTDGTGFTVLHSFTACNYDAFGDFTNSDGVSPVGNLLVSGNVLFGKASNGGTAGTGTLFSLASSLISPPAIASLSQSGGNLVINALNGISGATNQVLATTNLALPLNQWTLITTNILAANGNFTVTLTNAISPGPCQQFYTLQLQ